MSFLRECYRFVFDQSSFARFRGQRYRQAYWYTMKSILRENLSKRRKVFEMFDANKRLNISKDLGYSVHTRDNFENTDAVIKEVLSIVKSKNIDEFGNASKSVPKKNSFLIPLLTHKELSRDSEIIKFATSDKILTSVGAYFGFMPTLAYVNVWFSPNKQESQDGSQCFHLDHEDFTQLKVLMFIDDVDVDSGPMHVVSAESSLKIQRESGYRMTNEKKSVSDDLFDDVDVNLMTGKSGDVLFIDTSRCFHMGSRKGNKPRILLAMQFLTPMAFVRKSFSERLLTSLQDGSTDKERLLFNF